MQVREDLGNHRGINDRGDDLQSAATVWAVFNIDIEHALEQARRKACGLVSQARARDRLPVALEAQRPPRAAWRKARARHGSESDGEVNHLEKALMLARESVCVATFRNLAPQDPGYEIVTFRTA